MKIYKYGLIIFSVLVLSSCEKETEGLSTSAYYVAFDIKGDNPLIVQVGETFTDPGCVATLHGEDVSSTMNVESNVNADMMGMYKIEYSAVNDIGLASRAIRDVIVCNPSVTTNLAGRYTTQEGTERLTVASGALIPYPGYHATITYLAPGFFSINDFFGGYYAERVYPSYGYAVMGMSGYFALNEDNTIDLISSYIDAWGDALDSLDDASYDPATGEIKWKAAYAGSMVFNVILKK